MQRDEIERLKENIKNVNNDPVVVSDLLKKIFNKQKRIIIVISALELINEVIYLYYILLKKSSVVPSMKYLDRRAEEILEELKLSVRNAKFFHDMDFKIKQNLANELKKKKDYFQDVIDVLYGYYVEARYINDVINDKARNYITVDKVDEDEFYSSVNEFINEVEEEKQERIQEIISSVPFVMSKRRFYEYLSSGLSRSCRSYELLMQNIFDIEENFYGKLIDGYGEIFSNIAQKIDYMQSIELKSVDKQNIEEYVKESSNLLRTIQGLREVSLSTIRIINRLLILYMSDNKLTDVYEYEPFVCDYMNFYNKLLAGDYSSKEVEANLKRCDSIISDWYFELYRYNKLLNEIDYINMDISQVIDNDILDDIELLSEYENLINDDDTVSDETDEDYVDSSVVQGEIKKIISLIDDISKNMKNDYRRARMRRLMGIIPVPEDFEAEILNYLKNSIEFDTTEDKKAAIMESVKKRMELYRDLKSEKKLYEMIIKNAKDVI